MLGSSPNPLRQPQNILVRVESSTWHSNPMTVSSSAMTRGSLSKTAHGASTGGAYHRWMPEPAPHRLARARGADIAHLGGARCGVRHLEHDVPRDAGGERDAADAARDVGAVPGGGQPCSTGSPSGEAIASGDRPTRRNMASGDDRGRCCCSSAATPASRGASGRSRAVSPRLVIATVPLWMAVIDRIVFHHRQPPLVIGGLVLGFVGAAILVEGSIAGARGHHGPARRSSAHRSRGRAARCTNDGRRCPVARSWRPACRCSSPA